MSIVTKKCSKCAEEKSLSEYPNDHRVKSGKRADCKKCFSLQSKEYRLRTKEARKATKHAHYLSHKNEILANVRKWYYDNIERVRENQTKHRKNNVEKYKGYTRKADKKWREKNPDYKREWLKKNPHKAQQYRAKRETAEKSGGTLTSQEWFDILDKYENKCLRCGASDVKLQIDHIAPISRGGKNNKENVQPLCRPCNSWKYTKTIDYRPPEPP